MIQIFDRDIWTQQSEIHAIALDFEFIVQIAFIEHSIKQGFKQGYSQRLKEQVLYGNSMVEFYGEIPMIS